MERKRTADEQAGKSLRGKPGAADMAADFGGIKAVIGSEHVNALIDQVKQQEQIEAEQKRTAGRKHNREVR